MVERQEVDDKTVEDDDTTVEQQEADDTTVEQQDVDTEDDTQSYWLRCACVV